MRTTTLLLSITVAVLASDGYLQFDVHHEHRRSQLRRRDDTGYLAPQQVDLAQDFSLYWLNVSVGTPPQPMRLDIDTGSSDIVLVKTTACDQTHACPGGSFDPSKSSSFETIAGAAVNYSYGDGTAYVSDLCHDVISVGGVNLARDTVVFGLANELQDGPNLRNDGTGLAGLGYQAGSADPNVNGSSPPTLVSAMVANGIIARQAYSLQLGSWDTRKGNLIFGGVDPSLYTGDLISLPVVPNPGGVSNYTAFNVALTGISVTDLNGTRSLTDDNFGVAALPDSGTTTTTLPKSVAEALYKGFGVDMDATNSPILPCDFANANVSITYHFGGPGGPSINVPLQSLIQLGSNEQFNNGASACSFTVGPEDGVNGVILGDSFMRSAYFVFDLDNNQVAVAQAAVSPSPSGSGSVTAIPTGKDIPGCSSTNTFTLPTSQIVPPDASVSAPVSLPTSESVTATSSLLPATPTFDLGAVTTETATSSSSSSSSTGSTEKQTSLAHNVRSNSISLFVAALAGGFATFQDCVG